MCSKKKKQGYAYELMHLRELPPFCGEASHSDVEEWKSEPQAASSQSQNRLKYPFVVGMLSGQRSHCTLFNTALQFGDRASASLSTFAYIKKRVLVWLGTIYGNSTCLQTVRGLRDSQIKPKNALGGSF